MKTYLDELSDCATAPVIASCAGVLGAPDVGVLTKTTTFSIPKSLRLDLGPSAPLHP